MRSFCRIGLLLTILLSPLPLGAFAASAGEVELPPDWTFVKPESILPNAHVDLNCPGGGFPRVGLRFLDTTINALRYVSEEEAYTGGDRGMLRARATSNNGPWEKFDLCWFPDGSETGYWALSSRSSTNRKYVSAEWGYGGGGCSTDKNGMLRARSDQVGAWEKYGLVTLGGTLFALYTKPVPNHPSRWVSAEFGYGGSEHGMLRARATAIGDWEAFEIVPAPAP